MKLLLWLALCCSVAQGLRRYTRNDNCLKHNKYMHESYCRARPRRIFFAFHRIIADCVMVTTNCPRMYRHNEYYTLKQCREDCWFFLDHSTTTQGPAEEESDDGDGDGGDKKKKGKGDGDGDDAADKADDDDGGDKDKKDKDKKDKDKKDKDKKS
ncbi:hypothetical protein KR038_006746 [Drosophila bunnanda]|nr:hypothetical protein KR038_006746 [Drosophila bunnanda]